MSGTQVDLSWTVQNVGAGPTQTGPHGTFESTPHDTIHVGFKGTAVGGVIVYPVAPWLAHRAHSAGGSSRVVSSSS